MAILQISANTGGILSLFMGFSLFSIVEIFYFLTFRPCIHHMQVAKKRRRTMKQVDKKIQFSQNHVTKSLQHCRVKWMDPDHNSVFPYID